MIVWGKVYGYGHDYYSSYSFGTVLNGPIPESIGWFISTLTINNIYLGILIVSFLMAYSVGSLMQSHLCSRSNNHISGVYFFVVWLMVVHTWPILMPSVNVLRQGVATAFLYLALVYLARNNFGFVYLYLLFLLFSHKVGLYPFSIIILVVVTSFIFKPRQGADKLYSHILVATTVAMIMYFMLPIVYGVGDPDKIIGYNFTYLFLFIMMLYIVLIFFRRDLLLNKVALVLFYVSSTAPLLFIHGLNWQFERLGMIFLVPYILIFGLVFSKYSERVYLISAVSMLFSLTVFTGMYASLN